MAQQIFLTASIAANTTSDVTPTQIRTAPQLRALRNVGISGATVNTGVLRIRINGKEFTNTGIVNGVTRTAGAPIDQSSDIVDIDAVINENEPLEMLVSNTSGGALTYYVAYTMEEESDLE